MNLICKTAKRVSLRRVVHPEVTLLEWRYARKRCSGSRRGHVGWVVDVRRVQHRGELLNTDQARLLVLRKVLAELLKILVAELKPKDLGKRSQKFMLSEEPIAIRVVSLQLAAQRKIALAFQICLLGELEQDICLWQQVGAKLLLMLLLLVWHACRVAPAGVGTDDLELGEQSFRELPVIDTATFLGVKTLQQLLEVVRVQVEAHGLKRAIEFSPGHVSRLRSIVLSERFPDEMLSLVVFELLSESPQKVVLPTIVLVLNLLALPHKRNLREVVRQVVDFCARSHCSRELDGVENTVLTIAVEERPHLLLTDISTDVPQRRGELQEVDKAIQVGVKRSY